MIVKRLNIYIYTQLKYNVSKEEEKKGEWEKELYNKQRREEREHLFSLSLSVHPITIEKTEKTRERANMQVSAIVPSSLE
jgi:hypothetical protein